MSTLDSKELENSLFTSDIWNDVKNSHNEESKDETTSDNLARSDSFTSVLSFVAANKAPEDHYDALKNGQWELDDSSSCSSIFVRASHIEDRKSMEPEFLEAYEKIRRESVQSYKTADLSMKLTSWLEPIEEEILQSYSRSASPENALISSLGHERVTWSAPSERDRNFSVTSSNSAMTFMTAGPSMQTQVPMSPFVPETGKDSLPRGLKTLISLFHHSSDAPGRSSNASGSSNEKPVPKPPTYSISRKGAIFGGISILVVIILIITLAVFLTNKPASVSGIYGNPIFPQALSSDHPSQILLPTVNTDASMAGCSKNVSNVPKRGFQVAPKKQYFENDRCPEGSFRYSLTECDLMNLANMVEVGKNSSRVELEEHLPFIQYAMEYYDINCAEERIAAFLTHLLVETDGLSEETERNTYVAGAIKLRPENYAAAIRGIDYLYDIYTISAKTTYNDKFSLDQLEDIGVRYRDGKELQQAERSYLLTVEDFIQTARYMVAGWWFKAGAYLRLSDRTCGDLRKTADAGRGSENPKTGFYALSACINQSRNPRHNFAAKLKLYDRAYKFIKDNFKCQTKECPNETFQ